MTCQFKIEYSYDLNTLKSSYFSNMHSLITQDKISTTNPKSASKQMYEVFNISARLKQVHGDRTLPG